MKKYLFLVTLIFNVILSANEMTGREIMDEISKRHDAPFEFETQKMTLIDSNGQKEERILRRFSRDDGTGLFKYLLVFDEPKGIKGVGLLTWQNNDRDDDQWMYLPALEKVKRIAKGGSKNYFMGTDYAFEDLVSENKDKFKYERKDDTVIDSQSCYVINVYPNTDDIIKSTGYEYRVLYVRKDIFFTVRIDYFDKRGKFIKQQDLGDITQVKGQMYRANHALMNNMKENHKTEIIGMTRDFSESSVPAEYFKERYISSGRHIK
ncbi:MAG: outer membrane lipoprotein-sorting protein [Arcobacteraceae bacterium]